MELVKSRFRSVGQHLKGVARDGDQEWIPCENIADLVESGQDPATAAEAGNWVRLADKLRTPTSDLEFTPSRSELLETLIRGFVAESAGDQARLDALLASAVVHETDDNAVTGHVGAFYITRADGEEVARTRRTNRFRDRLSTNWSAHKDPQTYGAELADLVESESLLWNGDLKMLVDASLEEHAEKLTSQYEDKAGRSWGATLGDVAVAARDKREDVVVSLSATKP